MRSRLDIQRENLHLDFWKEAITNIDSWQYRKVPKLGGATSQIRSRTNRPLSQDGWLATLRGVMILWEKLKECGFTHLETRSLNQDPIENLFGCIRSNLGPNSNPTVHQFLSALKTCIVKGFAYRDLKGTNCEMESEPGEILNSLQDFVFRRPESRVEQGPSPEVEKISVSHNSNVELMGPASCSLAYVSGYIAKKVLHGNSCENCKDALTSSTVEPNHLGIVFKEYNDSVACLTYPSTSLFEAVAKGLTLLENMLNESAHKPDVKLRATSIITDNVDFQWLGKNV